jgi:hypothetical protein
MEEANGALSQQKAAAMYGVTYSTLNRRIHGTVSKAEASQARQRLSTGEEEALRDWITQLSSWGWPARIDQLRGMASELLRDKGDMADLGVHWTNSFLHRYPSLKTKFVSGLDKQRALAQDSAIFTAWFHLLQSTILQYDIHLDDIYNMDEKGIMMGSVGKIKVVVSRDELQNYIVQDGSREWVSLIECISTSGRLLPPWIIFKGKQHQKVWYDSLKKGGNADGFIALSSNGWTDNELGLEWLKQCFEPHTRPVHENSKYRLLIFDGHASHITTQAIRFCMASKIILLCLPPHTTHLLQPLDVGVFLPLATAYKKGLQAKTRYGFTYSIDKVDFLDIYQEARRTAITTENVQNAWRSTGINPWNPNIVMDRLPKVAITASELRPQTPKLTFTAENGQSFHACLTPANTAQVEQLVQQVLQGELNPAIAFQIRKLSKAASKAIANAVTQSTVNSELLTALKQKKSRTNRTNENYGYGRIMSLETLNERAAKEAEKRFKVAFDELRKLGPELLMGSKKRPSRARVSGQGNIQAFKAAARLFFLPLNLEMFKESFGLPTSSDTEILELKAPTKSRRKSRSAAQVVVESRLAEQPLRQTRSGRMVTKNKRYMI